MNCANYLKVHVGSLLSKLPVPLPFSSQLLGDLLGLSSNVNHVVVLDQRSPVLHRLPHILGARLGLEDIANRIRLSGRDVLDVPRVLDADRRQLVRDGDESRRDVPVERRPHEDLVCSHGLIRRHLVASLVDAGEAVIAKLARHARHTIGGDERGVPGVGKVYRSVVGDRQTGLLAANPVAGVVAISICTQQR